MSGSYASLLSRARPPAPDQLPAIRPQPRAAVSAPPPQPPVEPEQPRLAPAARPEPTPRRAPHDDMEERKPVEPLGPARDEAPTLSPVQAPEAREPRSVVQPRHNKPAHAPEPTQKALPPREAIDSAAEPRLRPGPRRVPDEPLEPLALVPARVEPPPLAAAAPVRPAVAASTRAHKSSEPSEAPHPAESREPSSRAAGTERDIRAQGTAATPAPTIHVHIGRVEVRAAVPAPASPPQPASTPAPRPGAVLAEYLEKRWRGER